MCVRTSVQGGRENERQGGRVGENTKPVTYPTDRLTAERERERERERTKSESESESETYRERASGRESARARAREENEREDITQRTQSSTFLVDNIPQFNKRPECPFQSSNHAGIPGRLVPSGPVVLVRAYCRSL